MDVHNYIDGLQKELVTTLMWFGIVFVMLMLILIGLLLTLATVFRIVNQEKINVKKFMGFSFLQLYRKPIILLSILSLVQRPVQTADPRQTSQEGHIWCILVLR